MKPRIVFDTSTLIGAALRKDSVPYHAFMLAAEDYEVCTSEDLITELSRVLLSVKFERYLPYIDRIRFLEYFQEHSSVYKPSEESDTLQPRCRDTKDDDLLLLAQSANADTLVTSDGDLLVLHPWHTIPILRPAEFLQRESCRDTPEVSTEDVP